MKTDVIINRDALYALRELSSESVNWLRHKPALLWTKGLRA